MTTFFTTSRILRNRITHNISPKRLPKSSRFGVGAAVTCCGIVTIGPTTHLVLIRTAFRALFRFKSCFFHLVYFRAPFTSLVSKTRATRYSYYYKKVRFTPLEYRGSRTQANRNPHQLQECNQASGASKVVATIPPQRPPPVYFFTTPPLPPLLPPPPPGGRIGRGGLGGGVLGFPTVGAGKLATGPLFVLFTNEFW